MKDKPRRLTTYLLPILSFLVMGAFLSAFLPLSGAMWQEVLVVSGKIHVGSQTNCTYSFGYWKTHPEAWTVDQITIGGVIYSKDEALTILNTSAKGDATYILAYQLIAAKLNILAGADDQDIQSTLNAADSWLASIGLGSKPKKNDRKTGLELASILEKYNTGLIGPGYCDDEPSPPSPEPAIVTTPEIVPTATVEPTIEPTEQPSDEPTIEPSLEPSPEPTMEPSEEPSLEPTEQPSDEPTIEPSLAPTLQPTIETTEEPTLAPSDEPAPEVTEVPAAEPTDAPATDASIESTEEATPEIPPQSDLPPVIENCNHDETYWGNHSQFWGLDQMVFGSTELTREELAALLLEEDTQILTDILLKKVVTVRLNLLFGADGSEIETALEEADAIFAQYPPHTEIPEGEEKIKAEQLFQTLHAFIRGYLSVPICSTTD